MSISATAASRFQAGTSKMKIGMVSRFFPEHDGIARFSENLCNKLFDRQEITKIGDVNSGTKYRVKFGSFKLAFQLREIAEKECLDVLHFQYIPAYFGRHTFNLNLLAALRQKIPVVCTLHEVYYDYRGYGFPRSAVLSFLERKVVKNSDKVVTHTPGQKLFLEGKYKAKNVVSVPLGLELREPRKGRGRSVLFLGIISRMKGLELLIDAMKLLPECKLQIVGRFVDKNHEAEIRKKVSGMKNVSCRFEWVTDKERWDYFKKADVVVLPYIQAHQSGILNDAVSAGVPVVVTRAGALHEMVKQFGFGEIAEKNPEAIADGIRKVLKNPEKYGKGLVKYRELANWERVAERHMELYKGILGKK